MIHSMTGFGKEVLEYKNHKINIEAKSLNSKQLDLNVKLPQMYREKDLEIRGLMARRLQRGKVELYVHLETTAEELNYSFNKALARKYYEELTAFSGEIGQLDFNAYLPILVKMPDVLKPEREELDEAEWLAVSAAIQKALERLVEFRAQEGLSLEKDFIHRIGVIEELLGQVEPFEKERVKKIRERFKRDLLDHVDENVIDANRFEQEMIFYLEKLDVTEEKVRLKKHCQYFLETLQDDKIVMKGKKLGFISQEIGREINTLGSKANDANLQRIVVQMKDELEKIKEQMMNIL